VVSRPTAGSIPWIGWAWSLLTASMLSTLASFAASQQSLRHAMRQVNEKEGGDDEPPGGRWHKLTTALNWLAALCLGFGIVCLIVFALRNYREVYTP